MLRESILKDHNGDFKFTEGSKYISTGKELTDRFEIKALKYLISNN